MGRVETPSQAIVFEAIVAAARAGQSCPTNPDLAARLGAKSVSTPVNAMSKLERAGRIVIERFQTGRDVFIPSLGIGTAPYGGKRSQHWRKENPERAAKADETRRTVQARVAQPEVESVPTRVDRDPCFRCGTRADIGCRHHVSTSVVAQ